jgi:hemoglobin
VTRPTLYEFAGGEEAFLALAAATHERCLQDPELNHPFSHNMSPNHIEHLAAYWAEVLGGPPRYSESLGGHSGMLAIHAGEGTGDRFPERFTEAFMQGVEDAGLPDDPEFRAALRSYMEWATRQVDSYSPPGSAVQADLPMPHWSWDGLAGTQVSIERGVGL